MAVQRERERERDDEKGEVENEEDCECDEEYIMIHGLIADAYYFLLSHLTGLFLYFCTRSSFTIGPFMPIKNFNLEKPNLTQNSSLSRKDSISDQIWNGKKPILRTKHMNTKRMPPGNNRPER